MAVNQLVIVDDWDNALGTIDKMECHKQRILHRAVSGFLFNDAGELLVQRRAATKYHCAGQLANSCCSHPHWEEPPAVCMQRRTLEEIGISTAFEAFGTFRYDVPVSDDLFENELVHLFWARTCAAPVLNAEEVSDIYWMDQQTIGRHMEKEPDITPWFRKYWQAGIVQQAFSLANTRTQS